MGSVESKLHQHLRPSRHRPSTRLNLFVSSASSCSRRHDLNVINTMRSAAAGPGRRYDAAAKAAASAAMGASSRIMKTTTNSNSPTKLSRAAKPRLVHVVASSVPSSLTSTNCGATKAASYAASSRLSSSSRPSSTTRAFSSTSSEFIQRYPQSAALPIIQAASLSRYLASSRTRQLWDAIVAGIAALVATSWLVGSSSDNRIVAQCDSSSASSSSCAAPASQSSSDTTPASVEGPAMLAASVTPAATEAAGASSPAAAASASPHATTANVVSFRPRWFNNILTSVGSSPGSTTSRGGGVDDDSASSLANEDTRGVMLQSTGKPYDVRCHQPGSIS
jgi:hypothetical protein